MATTAIRARVIEEIQHMPEDKLDELYDLLHFFRAGFHRRGIPTVIQKASAGFADRLFTARKSALPRTSRRLQRQHTDE